MFFWNSYFFYDLSNVSVLISGSSTFSKSSLNIWKFSLHVLLKLYLANFKHDFSSMWDECNYAVVADTWGSPSSRAFTGDLLPLFSTGSVWCWPASHRGLGIPREQPHFSAPWPSPHLYHTGSHASYLRAQLPAAFKDTHGLPLADCYLAKRS